MTAQTDDTPLNGDLARRVTVSTADMTWSASPSPNVLRKRVHRVGPAESGQVTSIVRYLPNSRFPLHDHPDGEEILVLDGVFSDQAGDWPAGSYLLNPEGFRHAPFSGEGCIIFVKLRQSPGVERDQVQLQTRDLPWEDGPDPGVRYKILYQQEGFADRMRLEAWHSGTAVVPRIWQDGAEIFIIAGELRDETGAYPAGTWLRVPPGTRQRLGSPVGCEIYIKEGGFAYLLGA